MPLFTVRSLRTRIVTQVSITEVEAESSADAIQQVIEDDDYDWRDLDADTMAVSHDATDIPTLED